MIPPPTWKFPQKSPILILWSTNPNKDRVEPKLNWQRPIEDNAIKCASTSTKDQRTESLRLEQSAYESLKVPRSLLTGSWNPSSSLNLSLATPLLRLPLDVEIPRHRRPLSRCPKIASTLTLGFQLSNSQKRCTLRQDLPSRFPLGTPKPPTHSHNGWIGTLPPASRLHSNSTSTFPRLFLQLKDS